MARWRVHMADVLEMEGDFPTAKRCRGNSV